MFHYYMIQSVDELYWIYQISKRITILHYRTIPPEYVGYDEGWKNVTKYGVNQSYYENALLFVPIKQQHHQNMHWHFLNPWLHNFFVQIQAFLLDIERGHTISNWVDKFSRRKHSKHL